MRTIDRFIGAYAFLSNFYQEGNGKSVEHRYQTSKASTVEDFDYVWNAPTPAEAKRRGRQIEMNQEFESSKDEIMEHEVWWKFFRDPKLAAMLLATGDAELVEGNYWHDNYWGDCKCGRREECREPGQNKLGKILMKVRADLREQHERHK